MFYCPRCLLPSTKPDLHFIDGVCSACIAFAARAQINWAHRAEWFTQLVKRYQNPDGYDCIIPVSGGKDSYFQVLTAVTMGLHPLCVTATTCDPTQLGRRNLKNLQRIGCLGVDHIEFTCNPLVTRRLNRIGLLEVGDISWPEHVRIFTLPVRIAIAMNIPLILWGENSQNEYGGPPVAQDASILNRRWLEEFGGLNGMRTSDLIGYHGLSEDDLRPYLYPSSDEVELIGVTGVFMGHYFPWDGALNAIIARRCGFETSSDQVPGALWSYENLDNHHTGIHDYFKYLKFGFGRATDQVSMAIRRGAITREEGIELVLALDGEIPTYYLGKSLTQILFDIGVSETEYRIACQKFTNLELFEQDGGGMGGRGYHISPKFKVGEPIATQGSRT
jgi:N-acetyl sugar amidotransferase